MAGTILYVGNRLATHGFTPTSIETLGPLLAEMFPMVFASDKKNVCLRFLHMVVTFFRYRSRLSLVLIDTYSGWSFYYALGIAFLAKRFRIDYIPILHGGNLPSRLRRSPRLSAFIFGNARRLVAPSRYIAASFEAKGYVTQFIPNHIKTEHYSFLPRKNCRPRLLYVRALEHIYNPAMAIRVLAGLHKNHPDARLCMVGPDKDGSLTRLQNLSKELGVEDYIVFTGKLSKSDWIKKSEKYDFFVNTSNFDNHPISVTEAMALGMIIISTNVGGLPFLIEDGKEGFLVNENNVKHMIKCIEHVISDPIISEQLSKNANEKSKMYSWDIIKKFWGDVLSI